MSNMNEPKHPGQIVYVDGETGKITHTDRAEDVPPAMRFADTPQGKVPVVKVIGTAAGKQFTIREYGPEGQLLRSTVQFAP